MEGLTITEMANALSISKKAVAMRILRGGHKPITKDAVYSAAVLEAIRNVSRPGRPPKAKPTDGLLK
jgi:hypothetical protein